ncbi:MAG: hypothetical protein ACOYNS_03455 [Bacteroidota bacterium]
MKQYRLLILVLAISALFVSCDQSTGSDKYNAVWSPSGDPNVTKWSKPSGVTEFSQFDNGFAFSTNVIKDSTIELTFSPVIYQVANIGTASDGTVSFDISISSPMDSIALLAGGKVAHQYGKLSGTVGTSGDSVSFRNVPFTPNASNTISLSVRPDSCSKLLRFNVALQYNNFTGGTPLNALPTTKKIEVSIKNVMMRINGIDVIR